MTFSQPSANGSGELVEAFANVTGQSNENITILENTTDIVFELNATDDVTPVAFLNYTWYYDGVANHSGTGTPGKSETFSFDFFDSGSHNVSVVIEDTTLESFTWTWFLDITNVNRPPTLINNLTSNLTIDSTTSYPNFFQT